MHFRLFSILLLLLLVSCAAENRPTAVSSPQITPTQTRPAAPASPTQTPAVTDVPTSTPQATAVTKQSPPNLRYLQAAIEETLSRFDGLSSYVVVDLDTGQRIARNEDVALAGMSLVKVPILINTYRVLDGPPNIEQTKLITETTALSSNFAANLLLQTIAGKPDAYAGADIVSQSMRDLGVYNTFIAVPIDADPREGRLNTVLTPANRRTDITTHADPFRQTTTGDLAQLFQMIYDCAERGGGPLRRMYPDQLTAGECRDMLQMLQLNELATLLENGLPEDVPFSHKVGWIDDTHGDGGILFSPGGDAILVMALYAPSWLEWEKSAPLFELVARQTYLHFNKADVYAGVELPPEPALAPATGTPDLPHAIVSHTQGIGLTVRETPGGPEVAIYPEGTVLTLLAEEPVEHNGFQWYRVRTQDGELGWAADDYFTLWEE
ncbi:MAG: SH3 domain-containing protein [Chloroflexi bacterium]|jgi:beta-lactamase class A|nr:SH3 domain-containing protein [Chloroflexota bacterium]